MAVSASGGLFFWHVEDADHLLRAVSWSAFSAGTLGAVAYGICMTAD
jgi:hypothetical protein